jgi:ribosomal protein L7/L12
VPTPEVAALVERGRKIQAIKRYRQLNPGIGLKEAKDVIDGLVGRVLSSGGAADPAGTP